MDEDQKFYVTPNRSLDVAVIGDVEYFPVGSSTGRKMVKGDTVQLEIRDESELFIEFKNSNKEPITLYGEEADTAWQNYRRNAGSMQDRVRVLFQERQERQERQDSAEK